MEITQYKLPPGAKGILVQRTIIYGNLNLYVLVTYIDQAFYIYCWRRGEEQAARHSAPDKKAEHAFERVKATIEFFGKPATTETTVFRVLGVSVHLEDYINLFRRMPPDDRERYFGTFRIEGSNLSYPCRPPLSEKVWLMQYYPELPELPEWKPPAGIWI